MVCINIYLPLAMGLRICLKSSNGCSRGISLDRSPWRRSCTHLERERLSDVLPVPHRDGPDCNSLAGADE